ncbi:MAG: hypothetical protein GY801_15455 [bacterium]|nr:hypothetical protein [bacterium]
MYIFNVYDDFATERGFKYLIVVFFLLLPQHTTPLVPTLERGNEHFWDDVTVIA